MWALNWSVGYNNKERKCKVIGWGDKHICFGVRNILNCGESVLDGSTRAVNVLVRDEQIWLPTCKGMSEKLVC